MNIKSLFEKAAIIDRYDVAIEKMIARNPKSPLIERLRKNKANYLKSIGLV
jgi:hypothetical protein